MYLPQYPPQLCAPARRQAEFKKGKRCKVNKCRSRRYFAKCQATCAAYMYCLLPDTKAKKCHKDKTSKCESELVGCGVRCPNKDCPVSCPVCVLNSEL